MAEITSAKAMARTVRVSPRKSRLVLDNIRGKSVADAIAILTFTPNKAAEIILKVLNSAVANAENNFGLDKANLVVSEAFANEGPTMKRFRPRAKGSALDLQTVVGIGHAFGQLSVGFALSPGLVTHVDEIGARCSDASCHGDSLFERLVRVVRFGTQSAHHQRAHALQFRPFAVG